ncbi:hypothetical protein TNCV_1156491 [Trichonephila clavipes]|nr:hypothetical protein TNCV_1156491 [Trichonephila clavipes]
MHLEIRKINDTGLNSGGVKLKKKTNKQVPLKNSFLQKVRNRSDFLLMEMSTVLAEHLGIISSPEESCPPNLLLSLSAPKVMEHFFAASAASTFWNSGEGIMEESKSDIGTCCNVVYDLDRSLSGRRVKFFCRTVLVFDSNCR